jgi:DNA-directed RNA polymerase subunit N (RpoN/RPB10)
MLYMFCPTCRELLGDKQKYYERKMAEICQKYDTGKYTKEQSDMEKQNLVNSIGLRRYCCKQRILSYVRVVDIIK